MELIKVKTARFRDVVAACGKPQVLTLWADPSKDPGFQKALKQCRVMSVHQTVVGSKKDFAEIGYVPGGHIAILLFPKSLSDYGDRRIIGVDYDLVEKPAAEPFSTEREKRPKESKKETGKLAKKVSDPEREPDATPATLATKRDARPPALGKQDRTKSKPAPAPKVRPEPPPEPEPEPEPLLDPFMIAAINEARKSLEEGGVPTGAALVRKGKLLAIGRNQRVQKQDPTAHAELDCLRAAGCLDSYEGCTLYSTMMPCTMCAGAAVQLGIRKVVVGEARNSPGASALLEQHGIDVIDLDLPECFEMVEKYSRKRPKQWDQEVGPSVQRPA